MSIYYFEFLFMFEFIYLLDLGLQCKELNPVVEGAFTSLWFIL
jgi:hypothetical protein